MRYGWPMHRASTAIGHLVICVLLAVGLAACTTNLAPQAAAKLRALDFLNDDMASLVVAVDTPSGIQPIPEASSFRFDFVSAGQGERHVSATLTLTDPGELAGTLPPPANGRAYYLFGFSDADKTALREAQAWARALPPGTANASSNFPVSIAPKFCRTAEIDPARASFSILVALPGDARLEPLVTAQPVSATTNGEPVPPCETSD
jgi:hypothetical protein